MNHSDENNLKVVAAKIGALMAIGFLSFFCGILPYYSIRAFRNRFPTCTVHHITSGFVCFSGGTLLGVTFLHLMPEVREKIIRLQRDYHVLPFPECLPLSDIIAMSGFFGVYVLDEILHMCVEWYSLRIKRLEAVKANLKSCTKNKKVCSQLPNEVSVFSLDNHENNKHQVSIRRRSNHRAILTPNCICQPSKSPLGDATEEKELCSITQQTDNCEFKTSSTILLKPDKNLDAAATATTPATIPPPAVISAGNTAFTNPQTLPQVSGFITIAALSFHDIFEGVAIGIERNLNSILFLYLSIASHKYAIAFCIGMNLVGAGSRLKLIIFSMMTFSVVSPIGVIVGMIVVAESAICDKYDIDSPASVVMQGIAAGTLIYVVCFEVLQREGTDTHKKGIQNVMFVIFGFLVTLGFKVLTGHSHS